MRVLFGKIHFPFCFCKPSSHLLYTPSPLKLENNPQTLQSQSSRSSNGSCNYNVNHPSSENGSKSILRKTSPDSSLVEKKKVQWADLFSKQLVEIREFESCEDEDTNYRRVNNRRCVCTIL